MAPRKSPDSPMAGKPDAKGKVDADYPSLRLEKKSTNHTMKKNEKAMTQLVGVIGTAESCGVWDLQ